MLFLLGKTKGEGVLKINRDLQSSILKILSNVYPNNFHREEWLPLLSVAGDKDTLVANLLYLEEHKLLTSGITRCVNDYMINLGQLRITNRGLDFLLNDGGVNAILGADTD